MKPFILISTIIIIAGIGVLCITLNLPKQLPQSNAKIYDNFCGTNAFYGEYAAEGKSVFNTNCASCHQLDRKMIGPALRNINEKFDSITISKYIKGQKELIESKGYGMSCIDFPNFTNEDISHLLSYTN